MSRRGLDKEQVVEAAATLADEVGYDALSLSTLADTLGIRSPSLYKHVDGLPALKRELALLGGRRLTDALRRAAVGKAGTDEVLAVLRTYRAFLREHPGLGRALEQAPAADDKELQTVAGEILDLCVAVLQNHVANRTEALHAIRAVRSMVHGFCRLETAGGFGLRLSLDESFDRMIAAYLRGLASAPPGRPGK